MEIYAKSMSHQSTLLLFAGEVNIWDTLTLRRYGECDDYIFWNCCQTMYFITIISSIGKCDSFYSVIFLMVK